MACAVDVVARKVIDYPVARRAAYEVAWCGEIHEYNREMRTIGQSHLPDANSVIGVRDDEPNM